MTKKYSVLKTITAIVFILMAVHTAVQNIGMLISNIINWIGPTSFFNLVSIAIGGLTVPAYLLIGIACFLPNGRKLTCVGVAIWILGALVGLLFTWITIGLNIVQFGLAIYLNMHNAISLICSQLHQLLRILIPVTLLLVLIINKKGNPILCIVPSGMVVLAKCWYLFYTVMLILIRGNVSMSVIVNTVMDMDLLLMLVQVFGYAALCFVMTRKQKQLVPVAE